VTFTVPSDPFVTVQASSVVPPGPVTTGAPLLADAGGGAARSVPPSRRAVSAPDSGSSTSRRYRRHQDTRALNAVRTTQAAGAG
jgi:hypothetical protein